jgi:hypothetical protein
MQGVSVLWLGQNLISKKGESERGRKHSSEFANLIYPLSHLASAGDGPPRKKAGAFF